MEGSSSDKIEIGEKLLSNGESRAVEIYIFLELLAPPKRGEFLPM